MRAGICTLAALLWKIAADAIQIVLLYTPEQTNILNQGKHEKPFFKIINWKNLDLYYGFLIIYLYIFFSKIYVIADILSI